MLIDHHDQQIVLLKTWNLKLCFGIWGDQTWKARADHNSHLFPKARVGLRLEDLKDNGSWIPIATWSQAWCLCGHGEHCFLMCFDNYCSVVPGYYQLKLAKKMLLLLKLSLVPVSGGLTLAAGVILAAGLPLILEDYWEHAFYMYLHATHLPVAWGMCQRFQNLSSWQCVSIHMAVPKTYLSLNVFSRVTSNLNSFKFPCDFTWQRQNCKIVWIMSMDPCTLCIFFRYYKAKYPIDIGHAHLQGKRVVAEELRSLSVFFELEHPVKRILNLVQPSLSLLCNSNGHLPASVTKWQQQHLKWLKQKFLKLRDCSWRCLTSD